MTKKTYTVVYERDEDGWWIVEVKEIQGCRSDGRTILEARRRIRQALELFDVDPEAVKLVDDIRLPALVRRALALAKEARERAESAQEEASSTATAAVKALTKDVGLSVRDAGDLIGLSYQRVHQLAHGR